MNTFDQIVMGQCEGTGANIYVCLGFKPRRVEVRNIDSAALAMVVWQEGMELVAAIAEGEVDQGIADTDFDRTATAAAAGISLYAGGDLIHWDSTDARWEDEAAADVSEKFVDGHFKKTTVLYRNIGDVIDPHRSGAKVKTTPGFILADNAPVNVDGNNLLWIAYR